MAFTRKKTKPTPAPAKYGRAKKEEEPVYEEQEEIETEEGQEVSAQESDYEDEQEVQEAQPVARPARSYAPQAPRPSAPPSRGGYGRTQNGGGNNNGKGVRITGLFAGKREGCFSGKLRADDIASLMGLLEDASSSNQEVVFFLWENQPEQGRPLFSLTGNIAQPRQFGGQAGQNRGYGRSQGYNRGRY